jgi:hypothetical protein
MVATALGVQIIGVESQRAMALSAAWKARQAHDGQACDDHQPSNGQAHDGQAHDGQPSDKQLHDRQPSATPLYFLTVQDARRKQVFYTLWELEGGGAPGAPAQHKQPTLALTQTIKTSVDSPESACEKVSKALCARKTKHSLIYSGNEKFIEHFESLEFSSALFNPLADKLSALAFAKIAEDVSEDAARPSPIYLRRPDIHVKQVAPKGKAA